MSERSSSRSPRLVLVLTGAAGFLGSAIAVDLARDYQITAIDRREPGQALRRAVPGVAWERLDISDARALAAVFRRARAEYGRIDFVIHLAAFYHFGTEWLPEYEETNVRGTSNVLRAARMAGARRVFFASSIAAMRPPPPGQVLTEESPTGDFFPYAKSKTMGEAMVAEWADKLPGVALRIGGAFSDWCELPPLYSLIKLWSGWGPWSRIVPGRGESGIPYIHRADVVRIVRRCLECHTKLDAFEVLLASQAGAVSHRALFRAIRALSGRRAGLKPILVSAGLARWGLSLKLALGSISGHMPYERPWMLSYVDHPWAMDTRHTQQRLDWRPGRGMGVLEGLPLIMARFANQRRAWEARNRRRNAGGYLYSPTRQSRDTDVEIG